MVVKKSLENDCRIDKYLWSVRLFKTRSIAADACKKGRIYINDIPVKPSRQVSKNEIITVKKPPILFSYRIIGIPASRVSAKLLEQYLEDITPEEEKIKLEIKAGEYFYNRDKGEGRPTKKERRQIDKLRKK